MLVTVIRRSIQRMLLMNVIRRLLFVPAAMVLLFAWVIGIILSPVVWPVVWVVTGRNIFEEEGIPTLMRWMEEQVERILPN